MVDYDKNLELRFHGNSTPTVADINHLISCLCFQVSIWVVSVICQNIIPTLIIKDEEINAIINVFSVDTVGPGFYMDANIQ